MNGQPFVWFFNTHWRHDATIALQRSICTLERGGVVRVRVYYFYMNLTHLSFWAANLSMTLVLLFSMSHTSLFSMESIGWALRHRRSISESDVVISVVMRILSRLTGSVEVSSRFISIIIWKNHCNPSTPPFHMLCAGQPLLGMADGVTYVWKGFKSL